MRDTAISAMLVATAFAGRQQSHQLAFKTHMNALAKHAKNLQMDDEWWTPLPPDRRCY